MIDDEVFAGVPYHYRVIIAGDEQEEFMSIEGFASSDEAVAAAEAYIRTLDPATQQIASFFATRGGINHLGDPPFEGAPVRRYIVHSLVQEMYKRSRAGRLDLDGLMQEFRDGKLQEN